MHEMIRVACADSCHPEGETGEGTKHLRLAICVSDSRGMTDLDTKTSNIVDRQCQAPTEGVLHTKDARTVDLCRVRRNSDSRNSFVLAALINNMRAII
jgi:hypothetical protein